MISRLFYGLVIVMALRYGTYRTLANSFLVDLMKYWFFLSILLLYWLNHVGLFLIYSLLEQNISKTIFNRDKRKASIYFYKNKLMVNRPSLIPQDVIFIEIKSDSFLHLTSMLKYCLSKAPATEVLKMEVGFLGSSSKRVQQEG